ncbi:hypothetical protein KDL01_39595, partial [Actinospica durhamensis]
WRAVPAFSIPRERRVTPPPKLPEPKQPVTPRPQDLPAQAPLITVRAAKAQNGPRPPRRPRADLAVRFLAPEFPQEGEPR